MLVKDRSAREDVWTRASPVLALVLLTEVILAGNLDWPPWANVFGAIAALVAAVAVINRLRGRPALALPEDVGAIELGAFVAIGGLLQLIGGQTTSAWVVCLANLVPLLVLYVWIAYGVASILRFTGRRIGEQLAAAVDLLARAIPLLLLFSVVLFINSRGASGLSPPWKSPSTARKSPRAIAPVLAAAICRSAEWYAEPCQASVQSANASGSPESHLRCSSRCSSPVRSHSAKPAPSARRAAARAGRSARARCPRAGRTRDRRPGRTTSATRRGRSAARRGARRARPGRASGRGRACSRGRRSCGRRPSRPRLARGTGPSAAASRRRPLRERAHRNLRAAFRAIADRLDEAGLLRTDAQAAADSLYAIASDGTYLRMTDGAGLAPDRYADWLADTLGAAVMRATRDQAAASA